MCYQFTAVSVSVLTQDVEFHGKVEYPRGTAVARDADGHWYAWQLGLEVARQAGIGPDDMFKSNIERDSWPINDDGSCTLHRDSWRHIATPTDVAHPSPLVRAVLGQIRHSVCYKGER